MAPSVISSFLGTRYFLQSKTFLPGWGPSCNRAGPKVPSFHCQEASQLVTLWSHSLPVVPKLIQLLQLWWLLRIACKDATSHGVTCSSFPFPLLVLWAEDLLMENRVSWRSHALLTLDSDLSGSLDFSQSVRSTPSDIDNEEGGSHRWLLLYFGQWQGAAIQGMCSEYSYPFHGKTTGWPCLSHTLFSFTATPDFNFDLLL